MSTLETKTPDVADDLLPYWESILSELEREGVAQRKHEELPESVYHRLPPWSQSQLGELVDPDSEPELFEGRYIKRWPTGIPEQWRFKPTRDMEFGSAIHASIFQGVPLKLIPDEVLSKSGSKAGDKWKEWAAEHDGGGGYLKEKDADPFKWAIDSVMSDRRARALLERKGLCEHSIFWQHPNLGLWHRARLDKWLTVGNGYIVDLKTTGNPRPEKWLFHALDMLYHIQAASYLWGAEEVFGTPPDGWAFIVVGNVPPYACYVYEANDVPSIQLGFTKFQEACHSLASRLKTGKWLREDRGTTQTFVLPAKAFPFGNKEFAA